MEKIKKPIEVIRRKIGLWKWRWRFTVQQLQMAMTIKPSDLDEIGRKVREAQEPPFKGLLLRMSAGMQASERQKVVNVIQHFVHPVGEAEPEIFLQLAKLLSTEEHLITQLPREFDGAFKCAFVLSLEEWATNPNLREQIQNIQKMPPNLRSASFFLEMKKPVIGTALHGIRVFSELTECD